MCCVVTVGECVWPRPAWLLVWSFDYSGAPTGRERPRQIIERRQQALNEPKSQFDHVIKWSLTSAMAGHSLMPGGTWAPVGEPSTLLARAELLGSSRVGDGLLGASRVSQLEQNLASCAIDAGFTLPADVLAAFDAAWLGCRTGAFAYWRSYSADQPGREGMDQGGEYSAAKK